MNHYYTQEEVNKIAENTNKQGGSFARNLGKALQCADFQNNSKIKANFSDLLDPYLW